MVEDLERNEPVVESWRFNSRVVENHVRKLHLLLTHAPPLPMTASSNSDDNIGLGVLDGYDLVGAVRVGQQ